MSEYQEGTAGEPFWKNLPDVGGYLQEKVPTLDRKLDRYFDQNFPLIIEEWGLLRDDDLVDLDRRLNRVTTEIQRLSRGKIEITDRLARLDATLTRLEGVRK
jgi:hypothetical protein